MEIIQKSIDLIKPYNLNPKKHPRHQIEKLGEIIKKHGFDVPIVVDSSGTIIKGHARHAAAIHAGLKNVPVIVRNDLTKAQIREARIADNKIAELGEWDVELLEKDMQSAIDEFGDEFDTEILALDSDEPQKSVEDIVEPETPEPPTDPVAKPGDVWLLGSHRLVCGDSTIVRPTFKPHAIFTDPPYGVNYVSRVDENRRKNWGGIKNDDLVGSELVSFLRDSVDVASCEYAFVCCDWHCFSDFETAYGKPKSVIVWDKGSIGLGKGYRRQHEFILFFGTLNRTDLSDVWKMARDSTTEYKHPTQKPVALAAKALIDVSAKSVYDPFGGSGCTLLAAEQVGIKCETTEMEPKYCDVIIERWQNMTGKKAKRV